jgi:hypothetical protein
MEEKKGVQTVDADGHGRVAPSATPEQIQTTRRLPVAKTRLLNADREVIEAAILAHRFDPLDAAYLAEENALAIKIRAKVYGDYLPTMEAAPVGAFPECNAIRVNVDGRRILLSFGDSYRTVARVWNKHNTGGGEILSGPSSNALLAKVLDWANRREATKRERSDLKYSVRATLASFTTFEGLVDGWPEAASFANAQWKARGSFVPNLPAVKLQELSAALDLPPDVAEAA